MSQREFAARLGISERLVAKWEARGQDMTLRPSTQAIMDTFLETQVTAQTRTRFELTLNHQDTRAQDDRANTAGDRLNTATNQRWLAQAEGPHTVPGQDRPCQGCGQPLSRYNPGSFCQSCTSAGRQHQPAPPAELLIDGSRLAGLRCKRGMTQRLLADRAGISFSLIEKLERNARRSASLASLTAIARALNLPLDTLLDGSPAPDDLRRDHQRISSALLPQAGGKDGEDPVNRREFLSLSALTAAHRKVASELTASIAAGDGGPLATVQTTHGTDLVIAALTDQGSARRLRGWMNNGHNPVLRVNATGILAKLQDQDTTRQVAVVLDADAEVRQLYTTAVVARVGGLPWATAAKLASGQVPTQRQAHFLAARLCQEVLNPRDAGARWCSASLLRDLSPLLRLPVNEYPETP